VDRIHSSLRSHRDLYLDIDCGTPKLSEHFIRVLLHHVRASNSLNDRRSSPYRQRSINSNQEPSACTKNELDHLYGSVEYYSSIRGGNHRGNECRVWNHGFDATLTPNQAL